MYCEKSPIITNGDRIRAMTDDELDKFLGDVQWDVANFCGGVTEKQEYPVPEQRGVWLDWLIQPAEREMKMTKHDRMMKNLEEIKEFCKKNVDDELGCGKKCPFLLGNDGDDYRPCEIMEYVSGETPEEWGGQE